ncbi:MAG TPA: hypothetical protein VF710_26540 [Longimicrobium sp.]|jgi:hypothetical protein
MLISNRREWDRVRAAGKSSFVVQYGLKWFALRMGIFMWATLFVVVPVFMQDDGPRWGYLSSREFLLSTLGALFLWPVGGWLWAQIEWRRLDRKFGAH